MEDVTVTFERTEAEKLLTLLAASWADYGVHGGQVLEDAANKLSVATLGVPLLIEF